jgi:DNA-binding XRE family transcriptional regulator
MSAQAPWQIGFAGLSVNSGTNLGMTSEAAWQIEYATIGDVPRTAAPRNRSCPILIGNFGVASAKPLTGGTPISFFGEEPGRDPDRAARPARAGARPGAALDSTVTVRELRLTAGLSQTKLARLAGTTQPYVARLEAGSLDPGTDKLARLAAALSVSPVELFNAVRTQRAISL